MVYSGFLKVLGILGVVRVLCGICIRTLYKGSNRV